MTNVYQDKILIIGAGTTSLITAKTLLDDGFSNVSILTSADRVGGVWARGPTGGIYPSLLTNSAWGNFEYSWLDMPKDDFKETDGRIKAETVSDYLEDFYKIYLEGKLNVEFGQKVIGLRRPATGKGWLAQSEETITRAIKETHWDRVILAQGPHSNPNYPESLRGNHGFKSILVHSSQVHKDVDRQILDTRGRIVVIGCGKSAIDLATRYALQGREVIITFNQPKFFSPQTAQSKGDYFIKSRIISTIFPAEKLSSILEYLVHKTRIGSWYLRRYLAKGDKARIAALGHGKDSQLYRDSPEPIWRGPSSGGGRVSLGPKNFFGLVKDGKIDVRSRVYPVGISEDGHSLLLSDGTDIDAKGGAIIAATGFKSSWDFLSLEDRIQLGIEPIDPVKTPNAKSPTRGYKSLSNPPAAPSTQPASHVYKGIVPIGAWNERDFVMNGFAALLGAPYSSEITAHWISDFFTGNADLRLPKSSTAAFQVAEDHANWLRHRFPLSQQPWSTNTIIPLLNAQQYNDELIADLGLKTRGTAYGLRYYTGLVDSKNLKSLGEERRVLRNARPSVFGWLASRVKQVVGWPRGGRTKMD